MNELITASRGELSSGEILGVLDDDGRVTISVSMLGRSMQLVLREHQGTYYCDTPMKLVRHDTREGFRNCIEKFRLAKSDDLDAEELDAAREVGESPKSVRA